jgi:hypothetical protein
MGELVDVEIETYAAFCLVHIMVWFDLFYYFLLVWSVEVVLRLRWIARFIGVIPTMWMVGVMWVMFASLCKGLRERCFFEFLLGVFLDELFFLFLFSWWLLRLFFVELTVGYLLLFLGDELRTCFLVLEFDVGLFARVLCVIFLFVLGNRDVLVLLSWRGLMFRMVFFVLLNGD